MIGPSLKMCPKAPCPKEFIGFIVNVQKLVVFVTFPMCHYPLPINHNWGKSKLKDTKMGI
jgi:hypothetical protein